MADFQKLPVVIIGLLGLRCHPWSYRLRWLPSRRVVDRLTRSAEVTAPRREEAEKEQESLRHDLAHE